ncbi:MAG TPA: M2 family metallopeptidase [Longimicrobiales bacterium]|nr:M2 family metallopeptidase [Longimicrobiales bacterium]
MRTRCTAALVLCLLAGSGAAAQQPGAAKPTEAEARAFMDRAEKELTDLGIKASRADWVAQNFITDDTEELSADAQTTYSVALQRDALAAKRFDGLQLEPKLRRELTLLKLALVAPPPSDPAEASELTRLQVGLNADYGKGKYCRKGVPEMKDECLQLPDLEKILRESRDPKALLDAWAGWHTISRPMRDRYTRFVELSNKGARELGFEDTGEMWRAGYDMTPREFEKELDRLWAQVRPLYLQLHAYVRTKLGEKYGTDLVPPNGLIPAHLFGNMWAQEWGNIYDVVAPKGQTGGGVDITSLLEQKKVDQVGMAKYAEGFFTSLGLQPLPKTFWERSLLAKPRDRDVVCHASAWDIDTKEDVRIKACLEPTGEDFVTIHHEMGHDYYYLAYQKQPYLFQNGANDGFHEAIGDAIALSITPTYLKQVGLLQEIPPASGDTALLLRQAMDKVAFLPFGLLIDQWRWKVFSGEVKPSDYNKAWWQLRAKYQGIAPPSPRSEADFDPGAKYHVPANTPYTRYFLARILQFQFYRSMCRAAGFTGPLYRCSFYGSEEAGRKLQAMLEKGQSQPWQQTLFEMTGQRDIDASAMVEYFQPLLKWLEAQNKGKKLGWTMPTETAAN